MTDTNLVLVRHATAEDWSATGQDAERCLSSLGLLQAGHLADAAEKLGIPHPTLVLSSGYLRAEQTRLQFRWIGGQHIEDESFSPWGRPPVAAKILRKHHEEGHSALWVFSHNPFLSGFLEAFAPRVFDVVGKVRKSDLLWLRWREGAQFLKDAPDLKGFLSKPRVAATRSHQRDE